MADGCIFCDIASGSAGVPLVYEDEAVVAFNDIRPIAPTHILVIPKAHHGTLLEAHGAAEEALLGRLLATAAKIAKERFEPNAGFRVVVNNGAAAGQTVYHLHLHLLSGRHFAWPPG